MITMRALYLFIIFTGLSLSSIAQSKPAARKPKAATPANAYAAIDKKALEIPEASTATTEGIATYISTNFSKDDEKVRAAYIWVASNIQYDMENMFAINFREKKEDKINRSLKTRKGICENYAALFNDICNKAGIKSFVVEGYTKQNGFTDYIPHAWCAARIDTTWFLFDPTWGSGYVTNGKFVKKINNSYFQVAPAELIKSHMPFDYLWQFLYYPVTSQEFYEGKVQQNTAKPFFNYTDSIAAFEKLNRFEYYASAAVRLEKNGVRNSMLFDMLQHMRREVEIETQNNITHLYNSSLVNYNNSVEAFNKFIDYRNKQFKPEKTDAEIQTMLDESANQIKTANGKLNKIKNPDPNISALITSYRKQMADLTVRIDEQQEWLKKYLAKGKAGRRSMFTKVTWFGVPLN